MAQPTTTAAAGNVEEVQTSGVAQQAGAEGGLSGLAAAAGGESFPLTLLLPKPTSPCGPNSFLPTSLIKKLDQHYQSNPTFPSFAYQQTLELAKEEREHWEKHHSDPNASKEDKEKICDRCGGHQQSSSGFEEPPKPKFYIEELSDGYFKLVLPTSKHETIRDLKTSLGETEEGRWLGGGVGIVKIEGKMVDGDEYQGQTKGLVKGGKEKVLGDWTEMGKIWKEGEKDGNEGEIKRVVKVVEVPLSDLQSRLHILRFRDFITSSSSSPLSIASPSGGSAFLLGANNPAGYCSYHLTGSAEPILDENNGVGVGGVNSGGAGGWNYDCLKGVIAGGVEMFGKVRDLRVQDPNPSPSHPNGSTTPAESESRPSSPSTSRKRKGGKNKSATGGADTPQAPSPTAPQSSTEKPSVTMEDPMPDLQAYDPLAQSPYSLYLKNFPQPRGSSSSPSSSSNGSSSPYLKSFSLSPWNPPPHPMKLTHGHHIYLSATTLEGEQLGITSCGKGYFVNKCHNGKFDPFPRSPSSKAKSGTGTKEEEKDSSSSSSIYHPTLFSLFSHYSPKFRSLLILNLELALQLAAREDTVDRDVLGGVVPDDPPLSFFSRLPIGMNEGSRPWMVPSPIVNPASSALADALSSSSTNLLHTSDPLRTQIPFLLQPSSSITPPAPRDWNEEFVSAREMSRKTPAERLLRERLLSRLSWEFREAVIKGVEGIVSGEVEALVPFADPEADDSGEQGEEHGDEKKGKGRDGNEDEDGNPYFDHTYVHNGILFVRAGGDGGTQFTKSIGGIEAARVAAMKDLHGVSLLWDNEVGATGTTGEPKDKEGDDAEGDGEEGIGIQTLATAVVDFMGERWVGQSLLPGILWRSKEDEEAAIAEKKKRKQMGDEKEEKEGPSPQKVESTSPTDVEEKDTTTSSEGPRFFSPEEIQTSSTHPPQLSFRIVYGLAEPDNPKSKKINAAPWFAKQAEKLAKKLRLAKHEVETEGGKTKEICLSKEVHGLLGTDGRSYLIDLYRLQPIDVFFLEEELNGKLNKAIDTKADDENTTTQANGIHKPPTYPHRLTLLRTELLDRYTFHSVRKTLQEKVRATLKEGEKKQTGEGDEDEDPEKKALEQGINPEDLKRTLYYNPDAYVEETSDRPEGKDKDKTPTSQADEATQNVRDASDFLRTLVLEEFLRENILSGHVDVCGESLANSMHGKGINMRYLGKLAGLCPVVVEKERQFQSAKAEMELAWRTFRASLIREMIFRGSKHVLRRLLRSSAQYDSAHIISHFLNCLLTPPSAPEPVADISTLPDLSDNHPEWIDSTRHSVREEVIKEVQARFRFDLDSKVFEEDSLRRPQMLREICSRIGIQIALRDYNFAPVSPHINGADHSSEEDRKPAADKKKKSGAKKVARVDAGGDSTIITPWDVLNVVPIVKSAMHKSSWADTLFEQGRTSFLRGHVEVGQELMQDALAYQEQLYGAMHPTMAMRYYSLALVHHQQGREFFQRIAQHETALAALHEAKTAEEKAEALKRYEEYRMDDLELVKAEADNFVHNALRMLRQAIVVSERTNGIDHPDTIVIYQELAILELSVGNINIGLKLTKHVLELHDAVYGPGHPDQLKLLTNIALLVQQLVSNEASRPLFELSIRLSELIYTKPPALSSTERSQLLPHPLHGLAYYSLGQLHALTSDLSSCVQCCKEALKILEGSLGADSRETAECRGMLETAMKAEVGRKKNELENRERLVRRLGLKGERAEALRSRAAASTSTNPAPAVLTPTSQYGDLSIEALANWVNSPNATAPTPTTTKAINSPTKRAPTSAKARGKRVR